MNLRSMLRQYAQYESRLRSSNPCLLTMHQGQVQRLRYGESIHWMIDFGKALDSIDPRGRTALLLVQGAGYSHQEAVRLMGVSVRTLQRMMAEAEAALQRALERQEAGIPLLRARRCQG